MALATASPLSSPQPEAACCASRLLNAAFASNFSSPRVPDAFPAHYFKTFEADKTQPHWHQWKWQFKNRIKTLEGLKEYLTLTPEETAAFEHPFLKDGLNLPFAITPYYLDLMLPGSPLSPQAKAALRKTVVPQAAEFVNSPVEYDDPCGEDGDMVAPGLVHRYPDRVLLLVNETCSVYCRYCTRSRLVGSGEHEVNLEAAYAYLEAHPEVRDVLISGGDPLVMDDAKLEKIIARLRSIPSIKVLRMGTKIPTVLPQRITPELVQMLKRYGPFYMSIHFTHLAEITPEVEAACNRLADAGIVTFSQTVLMQGVNDDPELMKTLMQRILELRVRPYYLYQCDPVKGTGHFRTPIERGLEIMEHLRGHITGYAVPTFVVDGPGGGGKIPLSPNYMEGVEDTPTGKRWRLRNYKHQAFDYLEETLG